MKDLSFLEFKDEDTPELRSMKTYWQMVMDMPEPERKVFLQEERVKDEERHLQWMIDCNKRDDVAVADYIQRGKKLVHDYQLFGDDNLLEMAELWAESAKATKQGKYSISDIRKQRERVQWEKKKLKTMQQPDEQSQSSEA